LFAVVKGACDGGLNIPHSTKRFIQGEEEYDPKLMAKHIFGGNVAEYMTLLQKEDSDKFKACFSRYIKEKIQPKDLEAMYKKVQKAIRDDKDAGLLFKKVDNTSKYSKLEPVMIKRKVDGKMVEVQAEDPKSKDGKKYRKVYLDDATQNKQRHFAKKTRYNKQAPISKQQRAGRIYQKLRARAEKIAKIKAQLAHDTGIGQAAEIPEGTIEDKAPHSDSGSDSDSD